MFRANQSISSEFRGLFSLFFCLSVSRSLCHSISCFGFFPRILIGWNGTATWQISVVAHTLRNGNNSKNDAFMQKTLRAFYRCVCVRVCVVKLAIRIEMERNGYNYCQILSLISYVTCKYTAYVYLEFWSFTIQQRICFYFLFFCFL